MKREIKFRAWNKSSKTMVDLLKITPLALSDSMNTLLSLPGMSGLFIPFSNEFELMQFTGLTDRLGKEIYEGDIISIPDDYEQFGFIAGEYREVFYLDACFRLKPTYEKNGRGHTIEDGMNLCEVIGNIYENPELL